MDKKLLDRLDERTTNSRTANKDSKIKKFFSRKRNIVIIALVIAIIVAMSILVVMLNNRKEETVTAENEKFETSEESEVKVEKYYDNLTGELISYSGYQKNPDGSEIINEDGEKVYYSLTQAKSQADQINSKRINCVQIPNGTDARPQVGLSEAKIVYEAIAEGGITRFAALYRDAKSDVIGPVRSLRTYYLEWDLPYDCTIIHAGGESKALSRVQSLPHLSESRTYMWRDYSGYYAPNNLFTSAKLLNSFNNDKKYETSEPKVFPRMTPEKSNSELKKIRAAQKETSEKENEKKYVFADSIYIHVTAAQNYNVMYNYDPSTNSYLRSYEGKSGKHMAYTCKNTGKEGNKIRPQKDCGVATQLAPKVVVVMKVEEHLNQDNRYREDITTTGSGEAWIFQNGIVIEANWSRSTQESQLVFKQKNTGNEIRLAPGQTWITAIAKSYGYVKY